MREININIEGYNVNGICVGCLNYNRKMFYREEAKHCFKVLADIDVPDGLTMQVCWECLAAVRAANRFQAQILQSYEVLISYSQQNIFLNSPQDLSQYAQERLSVCRVNMESHVMPMKEEEPEVQVKAEEEVEDEISLKVPEPELDDPKLEVEIDMNNIVNDFYDDFNSQSQDASDDDIQLSKLKRKKEKKEKKSKKERKSSRLHDKRKGKTKETKEEPRGEDQSKVGRKLKNLPTDLVELNTLTDDQMWQVRSEDLQSEEFTKLKYKCTDCILSFNSEKLMHDHMSGKHRPKADDCQQCDVCQCYFLTKDNLSTHRSLHLQAYRCVECGFISCLKRVMARHAKKHGGEDEVYECTECDKAFSSRSKLSYHKNVSHQDRPQCDCCGKVFANKMTV